MFIYKGHLLYLRFNDFGLSVHLDTLPYHNKLILGTSTATTESPHSAVCWQHQFPPDQPEDRGTQPEPAPQENAGPCTRANLEYSAGKSAVGVQEGVCARICHGRCGIVRERRMDASVAGSLARRGLVVGRPVSRLNRRGESVPKLRIAPEWVGKESMALRRKRRESTWICTTRALAG